MDFIKKRLFLILCSAAFLLGIGLLVWAYLIGSGNAQRMINIKDRYDRTEKIGRQAVNEKELTQLQQKARQAQEDRDTVLLLARQSSNRPPVYADVFPEPPDRQVERHYYREFDAKLCEMVCKNFLRQLRAGDRPSKLEMDEYIKKSSGTQQAAFFGGENLMMDYGAGYQTPGSPESSAGKLVDDLRRQKAENLSIYATPDALFNIEYWKAEPYDINDREAMQHDSWFAQIAVWIQEDVIDSICQVNDTSKSVLENPVKRLIEVSFAGNRPLVGAANAADSAMVTTAGASYFGSESAVVASRRNPDSAGRLPCYVTGGKSATAAAEPGLMSPETDMFSGSAGFESAGTGLIGVSFTGRASDDLIDVVQFELSVVIDSSKIIDFINALQSEKSSSGDSSGQYQRNQITVLQMITEPLDVESEKNAGYHYGQGALTVLRLICEYFFFKSGYEELKPQPVKDLLTGGGGLLQPDGYMGNI